MADSILSSILSKPQFTIAKDTGEPAMQGCKVKRVQIQLTAFLPRHMREDGSTISDTRIIRPSIIVAEIIAPTIDDAEDAIGVMNDRQSIYTISTKGLVFINMMAQMIGTKQSAEMLSAAPFQMIFKELLQEDVDPVVCSQSGDSDNANAGIQILNNVTSSVSNLVISITNNFNSAIGS